MPSRNAPKPLIVLLGPTAVGKTKLSLELAERFNGEIVSADSRLFYRGMDIGTAKPTEAELQQVVHHLIDIAAPDEVWSLGRYKRAAQEAIDQVHKKGKVPFLVGGTGQYLRAISEGWVIPKLPPNPKMREVLNNWVEEIGPEGLYERLKVVDPDATEKILAGNVRRTVRAFEVIFHTGRRFSEQRAREPVPYEILQIGLNRPRPIIDDRIGQRVDQMMEAGFLEEVKALLDKGYTLDMPSMSAIGYRQLGAYTLGEVFYEEAVEEIKRVTRKFYRRQMNWFKLNDKRIVWFDMEDAPKDKIIAVIGDFLQKLE